MLKILHKDYKDKVKRLLSVMLPIIGTQIAIMGMNFFDASMSGQAGDADLAGAAIGGNIWMPVQTCFAGILLAAMPLIANLLGAGEKKKISTVVRHGMLLLSFCRRFCRAWDWHRRFITLRCGIWPVLA